MGAVWQGRASSVASRVCWFVFDGGEHVVGGFVFYQVAGGGPLAVQGVEGDHPPGELQRLQQRLDLGNLVGLVAYLPLGQHGGHIVGHRRQQVQRPPVVLARAADGLAIDRQRRPGGLLLLPPAAAGGTRPGMLGEEDPDHLVHRRGVHRRQHPPEGVLTRRPPPPGPPIAAGTQRGQHLLRRLTSPFGDRQHRPAPRQHRRRGHRQHRRQGMPDPPRPARIGH